jgi:cytochrome c-type biogenesis protein CcmE
MFMSDSRRTYIRIGAAIVVIVLSLGYLAYTGVEESKSYYVTIAELHKDAAAGDKVYSKRLRVAGNVVPGSIKRQGSRVEFSLSENEQLLTVIYHGSEAPPDTFKDNAQALAEGSLGRDGIFQAKHLQAKCTSKYAPQDQKPGGAPTAPSQTPVTTTKASS